MSILEQPKYLRYVNKIASIFDGYTIEHWSNGWSYSMLITRGQNETEFNIDDQGSISIYYTDCGDKKQIEEMTSILEDLSMMLSGKDKPLYR